MSKLRASFTYFRGNKEKAGRGASAKRPDETTWNQTGPTDMYKGEANLTLSNNLYVTARYAYVKNLLAAPDAARRRRLADLSGRCGCVSRHLPQLPHRTSVADGLGGWQLLQGLARVQVGSSYRKVDVTSSSVWPGGAIVIGDHYPNYVAQLIRDLNVDAGAKSTSGYLRARGRGIG